MLISKPKRTLNSGQYCHSWGQITKHMYLYLNNSVSFTTEYGLPTNLVRQAQQNTSQTVLAPGVVDHHLVDLSISSTAPFG